MAVKREALNFGVGQQSGHEPLAGASALAVNVIVDGAGAVHRRPALAVRDDQNPSTPPGSSSAELVSLVSPILAIHSTATGRVFAVDAPNPHSRIYELSGSAVHNLSVNPEGELLGGRRPIIAETEAMLVITAGGPPQKVLLSTPAQSSRLLGHPPDGTHVIAHQRRLLINDPVSKNAIRYSAQAAGSSTAGHEDWLPDVDNRADAGVIFAEARPDPVVAVHENTNEIFAFGTTNLQIYTGSEALEGAQFAAANAREFGCSAPYSVVKYDQNFGFIDQYRRIVMSDGRDFQVVSGDIQQTLDDISDLSDMFGYRATLGPVDALCWCSLKDGRTFAYQVPSKSWSLWQSWDDATNNFSPWPVRCSTRVPETGEMLVGCATYNPVSGDVLALSNRAYVDEGVGRKIVARVDTGFIDRGTSGRKLCRALRLTWRGQSQDPGYYGGIPSFEAEAFVQWRDDGGPWEHARQIEFAPNSETILRSLGVYRRRQWRVTFSGQAEIVLARAEEEFELLQV